MSKKLFVTNDSLSEDIVYKSAANHLHRIGLCLTDDQEISSQRKWYNKPIIVFTVFVLFLAQKTITTLLGDSHWSAMVVLGDWAHMWGIKLFANSCYMLATLLAMGWQFIYYYNYRKGVKPTFLRVFAMMSGSLSPKAIGLSRRDRIEKMIMHMRMVCACIDFNNCYVIPVAALITVTTSYFMFTSLLDTVVYGLPNAVLLMIWAHYLFQVLLYQMVYIHFVCIYLKLRIEDLNQKMILFNERKFKSFLTLDTILKSLNSLYNEINEYNISFFSKFYLLFWLTIGSITILLLFILFFVSMALVIKVIIFYCLMVLMSLFLFVIFTASSVNSMAFKSYKHLNNCFISLSGTKNRWKTYYRFRLKFLVCPALVLYNLTCS